MIKLLLLALLLNLAFAGSAAEVAIQPTERLLTENNKVDLLAWFDAADEASMTLDGERIASWQDKSGQEHHLLRNGAGPSRVIEQGLPVVQGTGTMLAKDVTETISAMTVYAMVRVKPGFSPIIAFRNDNITEFCAAGWTIGARPTLYTVAGSTNGNCEIEDDAWHLLTFVRNGAERRFYLDGMLVGNPTGKDSPSEISDLLLFAYHTSANFNGKLAELLIYRSAHEAEQLETINSYLTEKWAPLLAKPEDDLVAFIGNSISTGMYCGNGKTWTAQTAAGIPALKSWYNISQGGITTQGLAAMAAESIDPLLKGKTGRKVLLFWEGTNDLVLNKSTAEAAQQAMKDFCLARKKAGWQKIIILNILPRANTTPAFETERIKLNQLMRENYQEYADALIDIAANPEIGSAGSEDNKINYPDGVHLTAQGGAIVAKMVIPSLADILK